MFFSCTERQRPLTLGFFALVERSTGGPKKFPAARHFVALYTIQPFFFKHVNKFFTNLAIKLTLRHDLQLFCSLFRAMCEQGGVRRPPPWIRHWICAT